MIFGRLSFPFSRITSALEKISECSERFVAYEHSERVENTHVHFLAVGPTISTDTMKNYVRKMIGSVERTKWSFPKASDVNCITYMSKGKLHPVLVKGFTEEEIEQFRMKWVEKGPIGKKVSDKPTAYAIALEVHQTLHKSRTPFEDYVEHMNNELHDYEEYCQQAIKLHHKYRVPFSFFSIDKVVHTAFTMRSEHRESFVRKLTERYYK